MPAFINKPKMLTIKKRPVSLRFTGESFLKVHFLFKKYEFPFAATKDNDLKIIYPYPVVIPLKNIRIFKTKKSIAVLIPPTIPNFKYCLIIDIVIYFYLMIVKLITLIISSALALLLLVYYIEGVSISGGYKGLVIAALAIGLINFFLKPGLKLVFGPFIILSLGLFLLIINMGLLWVADAILPQLDFKSFSALILTTLLLSILNFIISIGFKK